MPARLIKHEVQLLSWSESHNGGAKIVLQVNHDDLEEWKTITARKGNHAGQRLMAVFVEVGDDETPVDATAEDIAAEAREGIEEIRRRGHGHFPNGLCGLAVKWCTDIDFAEWLWLNFGEECYAVNQALPEDTKTDKFSGEVVKRICKIGSRKELDSDEAAKALFNTMIRKPYASHRREKGLDEATQ